MYKLLAPLLPDNLISKTRRYNVLLARKYGCSSCVNKNFKYIYKIKMWFIEELGILWESLSEAIS